MNHYERLGVDPDATADDVKRAYRSKARENHPDKGGSAEAFAPIAAAYETLSNPQRRLLYDATGQDRRTPIEKDVEQILLTLFNEALTQADDIEIVAFVRERVKIGTQRLQEEKKKYKARRKKLEVKRGKVTSKSSVNLVHTIIDAEIKNIDAALLQMDHQEEVQKAIMVEIEQYSEKVDPWKPRPSGVYVYSSEMNPFGFGR